MRWGFWRVDSRIRAGYEQSTITRIGNPLDTIGVDRLQAGPIFVRIAWRIRSGQVWVAESRPSIGQILDRRGMMRSELKMNAGLTELTAKPTGDPSARDVLNAEGTDHLTP